MRYSIELKDRINVKRYGVLSFAKNMGKNLNSKYVTVQKNQQQIQ